MKYAMFEYCYVVFIVGELFFFFETVEQFIYVVFYDPNLYC